MSIDTVLYSDIALKHSDYSTGSSESSSRTPVCTDEQTRACVVNLEVV